MKITPPGPPSTKQLFERYAALVAPGLLNEPDSYGSLYSETREGGWRPHEGDPAELLLQHVLGGCGIPMAAWRDGEPVRCVGLAPPEGERIPLASIDLDGGYPITEFRAAWEERFGPRSCVVTSGSGKEGRYRLWFMVKNAPPVELLRPKVEELLNELGFPPRAGLAEVYPSPRHQSRLPLGEGGCVRFDRELSPKSATPWELIGAFSRLKQVDLSGFKARKQTARRMGGRTPDRPRIKGRASMPSSARAVWRKGAKRGHRQHFVREMVVALHKRGEPREECRRILQATAQQKLWRTDGWKDAPNRKHSRQDIDDTVDRYYDRYKQALPAPENLLPADCLRLHAHAVDGAGVYHQGAESFEVTVDHLMAFGARLLPLFRACWRDQYHPHDADFVIDTTRTRVRVHRDTFREAAKGTGVPYAILRKALGIFEDSGESYIPQSLVPNRPGDARCKTWHCTFIFAPGDAPRRPVMGDPKRPRAGYTARCWAEKKGGGLPGGGVKPSNVTGSEVPSIDSGGAGASQVCDNSRDLHGPNPLGGSAARRCRQAPRPRLRHPPESIEGTSLPVTLDGLTPPPGRPPPEIFRAYSRKYASEIEHFGRRSRRSDRKRE